VKPDIYCKGKEYEDPDNDATGNIGDDVATVERLGGSMAYVGSVVFSSTRLLNRSFDTYALAVSEFCKDLAGHHSPAQFRDAVASFTDLKVLVIGDTIFDRYSTVNVQGLTSKNRILSGRFISEDTQAGGALAVVRHLKQFTPHVKLISLVGTEPWVEKELSKCLQPGDDAVVRTADFTTVVKQRFVEPLNQGKELSKLFSINYIDSKHPGEALQESLCGLISDEIGNYDLVMAMDFGHGMLENKVRALVQDQAPFLSVNCQTNSNNHGFNVINRQYHRADSFSLDQMEIQLACGRQDMDFRAELDGLRQFLGAEYAWLTRGSIETIGLREGQDACVCPPFEETVTDSIGAGDAFCAVAALAAAKKLPVELATFMGQLAGAQAVRIVGNTEPISKAALIKGGQAMLSF